MKKIYLDYAAATPVDERVFAAMKPYFVDKFYNPSAMYLAAEAVHDDLENARKSVAGLLGARPSEIIFTAGGTEANNLAIKGVAQAFPGSHVVTTALEHDSVLSPASFLAANGWTSAEVKPKADGVVDPAAIARAMTDKTVLVSVMYANNEVGTVQPIKHISQQLEVIRQNRKKAGNKLPLYLHTDACQAANYLDLHVHRLGVDLMTLNGGKIYGPKQSGVLFVASHVKLEPLIHGGGQERGLRSGTENVAGAIGFIKALEIAITMRQTETDRLKELQSHFLHLLKDSPLTGRVLVNGSLKQRLPNNVHVTIGGTDNERLLFALDEAGIQAAAGSACSASNEESSHVLKAIGLSDGEARSSLRFTMGRGTTENEIRRTVETLAKIVA